MAEEFYIPKLFFYNLYILAYRSTTQSSISGLNLHGDWLNNSYILYTTHLGNLYNPHNAG